mmetsp:Transcript_27726/g.59218  ORF Transcript_27726/g.59218 Transcript_27726/m.59218 type:complete len:80 (+) Transcript_27726:12-251(+)
MTYDTIYQIFTPSFLCLQFNIFITHKSAHLQTRDDVTTLRQRMSCFSLSFSLLSFPFPLSSSYLFLFYIQHQLFSQMRI